MSSHPNMTEAQEVNGFRRVFRSYALSARILGEKTPDKMWVAADGDVPWVAPETVKVLEDLAGGSDRVVYNGRRCVLARLTRTGLRPGLAELEEKSEAARQRLRSARDALVMQFNLASAGIARPDTLEDVLACLQRSLPGNVGLTELCADLRYQLTALGRPLLDHPRAYIDTRPEDAEPPRKRRRGPSRRARGPEPPAADQQCPVCLEEADAGFCLACPCHAGIHRGCLEDLLTEGAPVCPLCRHVLSRRVSHGIPGDLVSYAGEGEQRDLLLVHACWTAGASDAYCTDPFQTYPSAFVNIFLPAGPEGQRALDLLHELWQVRRLLDADCGGESPRIHSRLALPGTPEEARRANAAGSIADAAAALLRSRH